MALPLSEIEAARQRIKPYVHETPVLTCSAVDTAAGQGRHVLFKCEHLQKVGAFKIRGATNALACMPPPPAVVTHSSGNHAQAIALAGKLMGIPAHIVMPSNAPRVKRRAVEDTYGATVYPCTPTLEARETTAAKVIAATEGVFVHPYNNRNVQAGQGTAGFEFYHQAVGMGARLDAVVIAIGGGGMFTGMASALKGLDPSVKVYGAEPEGANDCHRGFRDGTRAAAHLPGQPQTIADGLLTLTAESTFGAIRQLADGVITVSDEEIAAAQVLIMERMKQVVEPSAAVPLAALLSPAFPRDPKLRNVGVVLCGGNFDLQGMPEILQLAEQHKAKQQARL